MRDPEVIPELATCVYVNGVFTGSRLLLRGEPIWPAPSQPGAGEAIHIHHEPKGGREYASGQGSGVGR